MCNCLKDRSETSRGIEKKLKEDKRAAQYHIKLLLLGRTLFYKFKFKSSSGDLPFSLALYLDFPQYNKIKKFFYIFNLTENNKFYFRNWRKW
jgi:hypothetical protein